MGLRGCDPVAAHCAAGKPGAGDLLIAVVGDPVEFRADIESGDKLTCGDGMSTGDVEASTPGMTYTFSAPGDYEVRFEARNGAGRSRKLAP